MNQVGGITGQTGPALWDWRRLLKALDFQEVRLSRGFLRCRPEKWFPGFAAHWMPLAHSLGAEIRITDVRPGLTVPQGLKWGFAATVDDEPLGVFCDEISLAALVETVVPEANGKAFRVVSEYLARRLLTSLAASWSGPESSVVRFDTEMDPSRINGLGTIRIGLEVNSIKSELWLVLGKLLTDRLDGLWRRQIRSASKSGEGNQEVRMEIAQLAVPPAMLVEYIRAGTVIDLEVPVSDLFTLRLQGKPWLPAKLCSVNGNLGFEIVAGPVNALTLPEGTTRLAIEFCSVTVPGSQIPEIAQVGSGYDTGIALGDQVNMVVNYEKVAEAQLCIFEGRFAVSVL